MFGIPKNQEVKLMAKVGAQRASELTGRSKSTIQRAMNSGKLSFEIDSNGRRVIDVSELDRALGLKRAATENKGVEQELEKASSLLEMERMKMRIRMLEQQLETAENQIEDLKGQRDQWQKQASQVLITSQYSQKQAEELRAELKMREEKAKERRQQRLEQQMKKLKPNNENQQTEASSEGFNFQDLWKRVKSRA
jgi:predicted RNase H-like nuclease (RuvC/YqgF family)